MDLESKQVTCHSSVFAFDQYYQLGHPSLQALKLLVAELNYVVFKL